MLKSIVESGADIASEMEFKRQEISRGKYESAWAIAEQEVEMDDVFQELIDDYRPDFGIMKESLLSDGHVFLTCARDVFGKLAARRFHQVFSELNSQ